MRVFLVPLVADDHDFVALESAAGLAAAAGGAVEGLFVRPDPVEALSTLVEGASAQTIRSLARATAEGLDERSGKVRAALVRAAGSAGLGGERARFNEATGDFRTTLAAFGRVADATVLVGGAAGEVRRVAFEAALFHSARPVLLLARRAMPAPPVRLAVAWNASPEAARVVQAALPWLSQAREVHLLGAGTPRLEPEGLPALARYLAAHGIEATSHELRADGSIGSALLGKAKDLDAGCLIMGGYGRSRMQEMIFGGATRHILAHPDLPLLLAH